MPSNDVWSQKRKGISTICLLNVYFFVDIQQSLIRSFFYFFDYYN